MNKKIILLFQLPTQYTDLKSQSPFIYKPEKRNDDQSNAARLVFLVSLPCTLADRCVVLFQQT
ncbi:MAG: hypothetical protein R3293_03460, partial [Candidatus Promineifilaceae bacterium]|nr:hypothetical protein [Candidatus Promineifilaceae bacterium]